MKKTLLGSLRVTGMIFLIIAGARGFSQILAYVGATQAMAEFVLELPVHPLIIMSIMQLVILVLGCFMDSAAIILLTMPIFVPAIVSLGFDPVWFGAISVVNIEVGLITPAVRGGSLHHERGGPEHYTMGGHHATPPPRMWFCRSWPWRSASSSRPSASGCPTGERVRGYGSL